MSFWEIKFPQLNIINFNGRHKSFIFFLYSISILIQKFEMLKMYIKNKNLPAVQQQERKRYAIKKSLEKD